MLRANLLERAHRSCQWELREAGRAFFPPLLPRPSLILFCLCYRSSFLLPWTFPLVHCCQSDVSMTCTSDLVSLQLQLSVFPHCLEHKIRAPFPTLWVFASQAPDCFSSLAPISAVDCAHASASVLCKDSRWSFCLVLPDWLFLIPRIPPQKSRPLNYHLFGGFSWIPPSSWLHSPVTLHLHGDVHFVSLKSEITGFLF